MVALRADPAAEAVGTVDGADTALGQVTATLALIRSLTNPGGSFGASGSAGAVPLT
ncbi:copper transporter [Nocardioides hankookensis]